MNSSTDLDTLPSAGGWSRLAPSTSEGDTAMQATLLDVADRTRDAARAQGYAVGWAQGRREAARVAAQTAAEVARAEAEAQARRDDEHHEGVAALTRAAAELRSLMETTTARLESQGTRLAWELVEALVGHEVRAARSADVVARVLALAPVGELVRVRLHPDHLPAPGSGAATAVDELTAQGAVLAADPTLERLDALVELTEGVLDLRISTALERVHEVLRASEARDEPFLEMVVR